TTNCAVLGVTLLNIDNGYTFIESIVNAVFAGVGFSLALILFSGVRSKLETADIPETFKGIPSTLIAASIVSLSFMAFSGIIS
ncbi:MAG: electron transport complex protein RnfA, partial [Oscillospiraceae bacterium]|nr:electron transport complex protein RnfA [Oscillospiraceae bacterium]